MNRLGLQCRRIPRERVDPSLLDSLWEFYSQHNERSREEFEMALSSHNNVIVFTQEHVPTIEGMAAFTTFNHERVIIIYCGMTVLAPAYRDRNVIEIMGWKEFVRQRIRHPFTSIYWSYSSNSHNSYLLMPRNFIEYWPRHDMDTPHEILELMNAIARRIYGEAWQPDRGVITKGLLAVKRKRTLSDKAMDNPHIHFFFERNPRYNQGDSLFCLSPLHFQNLSTLLWRMLKRSMRRWASLISPTRKTFQ